MNTPLNVGPDSAQPRHQRDEIGAQHLVKEYVVHDDCFECCTCGGHQKLKLYDDYVEFQSYVPWMWPFGIGSLPCACRTARTAVAYHKIPNILHDHNCCGDHIMIPGVTNLPFRGPPGMFKPQDQAMVPELLAELKNRVGQSHAKQLNTHLAPMPQRMPAPM